MSINIVEIKAKCSNPEAIHEYLRASGADYKGIDHQVDTYFKVSNGRLKLREGAIENNLIQYNRPNQAGPKHSQVALYKSNPESSLKAVLTNACGILTVVDKQRSIYFIDNVKFHIDAVQQLGSFMEIEAIDTNGSHSTAELDAQCKFYLKVMNVQESDLINVSYSDLLLKK